MSLFAILSFLKNTSSLNEKEAILRENVDNEDLKTFFIYSLDSTYIYNIKKFNTTIPGIIEYDSIGDILPVLDKLNARELAGNKAIQTVSALYSSCTEELKCVLKKIILKDPDCGIQSGLIKRVWPDLLSETPKLCKAQSYSEKTVKKITFPAISDLKADGARSLAFVSKDSCYFVSSGGIKLHKISVLETDLYNSVYRTDESVVVDGELVVLEPDMKTIMSRKKGNGIVTKAIKNTISPEEANRLRFHVWDIIPLEVYKGIKPSDIYLDRRRDIGERLLVSKRCSMIDSRFVNSIDEAIEHFKDNLKLGLEGTILKNIDFLWEDKRVVDCVKFKLEIVTTMRCIGVKHSSEDTKYAGKVTSLVLESEEGKVIVSAGSGLTDEEIDLYTEVSPIGSYFDIKSNGLISDESGWSLYLPRVIEERSDKTKADDFALIATLSYQSPI